MPRNKPSPVDLLVRKYGALSFFFFSLARAPIPSLYHDIHDFAYLPNLLPWSWGILKFSQWKRKEGLAARRFLHPCASLNKAVQGLYMQNAHFAHTLPPIN